MRTFAICIALTWCGLAPLWADSGSSSIIAWGRNQFEQTNVPPDLTNVIAISSSGYPTAALLSDGSVVSWGLSSTVGPTPPCLSNVIAIDAGYAHIMARKHDGTLVASGYYGGSANIITEAPVG